MKKKVILSSIVTIALCLSLITGSTFALFTSEHQFNVAATAGKVKLNATLTLDSVETTFNTYTHANTFENGGTATLSGNELTLMYMTPGDAVNMTISSTNDSNVAIKYKVRLLAEGDLAPALEATIGTQTYTLANGTDEIVTNWTEVGVGSNIGNIAIQIHFPNSNDHNTQNTFQEKTGKVIVQLIAVQANGTDLYDNPPSTNP